MKTHQCCNNQQRNCFGCTTYDPYLSKLNKRHNITPGVVYPKEDHADQAKSADYYIGSELIAKVPLTMYQLPDVKALVAKKFVKGNNIGLIKSYITRDGAVWWIVTDYNGKHLGYLKHGIGLFDVKALEATASGKTQAETVAKQTEILNRKDVVDKVFTGVGDVVGGAGDFLSGFGKNLKWIIAAVVVLVLLYVFLSFKKVI